MFRSNPFTQALNNLMAAHQNLKVEKQRTAEVIASVQSRMEESARSLAEAKANHAKVMADIARQREESDRAFEEQMQKLEEQRLTLNKTWDDRQNLINQCAAGEISGAELAARLKEIYTSAML